MKDIVITERHIKKEMWVFLACVAAMELFNIYAVIKYQGQWTEIFLNIGFVLTSAMIVYLVAGVIRLIVAGIIKLFKYFK